MFMEKEFNPPSTVEDKARKSNVEPANNTRTGKLLNCILADFRMRIVQFREKNIPFDLGNGIF